MDDPERAAAWYGAVFGAQETDRIRLSDGSVFAVDLAIGDTTIALAGEYPDMGIISPKTLGGTYLALVVPTENADEVWTRAVESGATLAAELGMSQSAVSRIWRAFGWRRTGRSPGS